MNRKTPEQRLEALKARAESICDTAIQENLKSRMAQYGSGYIVGDFAKGRSTQHGSKMAGRFAAEAATKDNNSERVHGLSLAKEKPLEENANSFAQFQSKLQEITAKIENEETMEV